MSGLKQTELAHRGVIRVGGAEATPFLQNLLSNDVTRAAHHAVWSALLSPQGKFLHDMIIVADGNAPADAPAFLLECERDRRDDLLTRLKRYRLRSPVTLDDTDLVVRAVWGAGTAEALGLTDEPGAATAWQGGVAFIDPRHAEIGARLLMPAAAPLDLPAENAPFAVWDEHRLALGIPDGSRDLPVERAFLMESGFDELHGIDWQKGCYVGQELTARTKYRGLVKKRLMPVRLSGPAPAEPGAAVMAGDKALGEIRSVQGERGLALIRVDQLDKALAEGAPITVGSASAVVERPQWMVLPAGKD